MKAAVTDGKGNVWLDDVPKPEPDEHQCLCRMQACATCTGTDQKHIHDKLPWRQNYPGVLGHESIGVVIETGARVRNLSVGDAVLRPSAVYPGDTLGPYTSLWGGFAEYGLVTDVAALREDCPDATPNNYTRFQLPIPPELPIPATDATGLITLKETASYVASVGVTLCSSVAILGSGSVAISMCRFAKIFGAHPVIVVGRREEPLAYARETIGADRTVNSSTEDVVAAVRDLTADRGVDFVLDTTGDADFLASCLPMLTEEGKAAAYATYHTPQSVKDAIPADRLAAGATGEDTAHQYLLDCVRLGLVNLGDFYSHRMPFSQLQEGFELLASKAAFKVVFEMEETL